MRRLLILSSVRWNFLWQRHQALALAASNAGWSVDFLEPPIRGIPHAASAVRQRIRGGAPSGVVNGLAKNVDVARPTAAFTFLSRRAQQRHLRKLLPSKYDACILYLPTEPLVEFAELAAEALLYDNVVDWATAPRNWWPPSDYAAAEARMLSAPWLRMTDSHVVANRHWDEQRQCLLLPPAADHEFVEAAWKLPEADQPMLYFGTVRAKETDVQLLCDLAGTGTKVRVVGPVDDPLYLSRLEEHGVHCEPPVVPSALPAIVNEASALILPYASARTETLVPAKLWNCLASNRVLFTRGLNLPTDIATEFTALPADNRTAVQEMAAACGAPGSRRPRVESWEGRWREVEGLLSTPSR